MLETATETGYAWSDPTVDDSDCVALTNSNLGDYNTLYKQFVFQARDSTSDCTATITMTKLADSSVSTFTVSVRRGSCVTFPCNDGFIRNLDLDSCLCEELQAASGTLIDSIIEPTVKSIASNVNE